MKKLACFLIVVCLCLMAKAQTSEWDWAKHLGGSYEEEGGRIGCDAAGNVYVSGTFHISASFDTLAMTALGNHDVFITKLSPGGDVQWLRTIQGLGDEVARDLVVSEDGRVFLCGRFRNAFCVAGPDTLNNAFPTKDELFVTCLDADGNFQWSRSFGGMQNDDASSIALDHAGNVVIAAGSTGAVDFGGIQIDSVYNNILLAKLSGADGTPLWAKSIGHGFGRAYIGLDSTDAIYLAGWLHGAVALDTVVFGTSYQGATAAKFDSAGTLVWASGTTGSWAYAYDISVTPSGNMKICGQFSDSLQAGPFMIHDSVDQTMGSVFVASLSADGSVQWLRNYSGIRGLTMAANGPNTLLSGIFSDTARYGALEFVAQENEPDVFVITLDTLGEVMQAAVVSSQWEDEATGIAAGPGNDLFVAGTYREWPVQAGPFVMPNAGEEDIFIARLHSSLKVASLTGSGATVRVFPNPAATQITVRLPEAPGEGQVRVINQLGQVVYSASGSFPEQTLRIPVASLPAGAYWLSLNSRKLNAACRFSVVH